VRLSIELKEEVSDDPGRDNILLRPLLDGVLFCSKYQRYALKRYGLSHNRRFSIQEEPRAGRGDFVMDVAMVCRLTGARGLSD